MGWSCGYKNIQMQISHLLERDKVNTALFIPTPSCRMQYFAFPWLEAAVSRTAVCLSEVGRPRFPGSYDTSVLRGQCSAGSGGCPVRRVWLCARCHITAGLAGMRLGSRI